MLFSGPHQASWHESYICCRSHKDLVKEAAPHFKKARKFYDGLAAQLVQQGHALDVFACSLDQVATLGLVCASALIASGFRLHNSRGTSLWQVGSIAGQIAGTSRLIPLPHTDTMLDCLQVGLAEMQTAAEQTGGLLVQASTFHSQAFRESFRRVFAPPDDEGYLGLNSNAQLQACLYCFLAFHCLGKVVSTSHSGHVCCTALFNPGGGICHQAQHL